MDDPVRRFLGDELGHVVTTLTDEDDLLAPGMLDSLAIIRLVATLEDAEGITIEQDEIHPENFRSIGSIRAFIARKRAGGGSR